MAKPIKVEVTGETTGFERAMLKVEGGLSDLESKVSRVTGKMSEVGGKLTKGVTLPVLAAGAGAFKMAADYQDAIGAVGQVFGSAADDVTGWANNLESYFGVAKGEALQHASIMGSLLQNIGGMAEGEAAKTSGALVELAADLSATFGGSTESAVQALTGALKGNTTMLDNYGMSATDAQIKAKALELGLVELEVDQLSVQKSTLALTEAQNRARDAIKEHGEGSEEARIALEKVSIAEGNLDKIMEGTTGQMDQQAKQQAILALVTEQSGKVQGQAAREAEGASGQMKAFTTDVKNLATDMGTKLLPMGTQLIAKLRGIMAAFTNLSPRAQKIIMIVAGVAAAIGPLLIVLAKLVNATMTLVKASVAFAKFAGAATKASIKVVKAVATKTAAIVRATAQVVANVARQVAAWALLGVQAMIHAAKIAAAWLISMGPIALVIAAVVGLVVAIVKNWDTITEAISAAAKKVGEIITGLWNGIVDAFNSVKTTVTNIWNSLWNAVVSFFTQTVPKVVGQVASMVGQVISWVGSLPGKALSAIGNLGSTLIQKGKDLLSGFYNGMVDFFSSVIRGWLNIGSKVRDAVGDLGNILKGAGRAILQGLWNGMKEKWEQVSGWVGGLGDKISNLKGPLRVDKVLLTDEGQAIIEGLGKGMAKAWPGIEGQLATYTRNIAGFSPSMNLAGAGVSGLRSPAMAAAAGRASVSAGAQSIQVNVKSNANPHEIAREVAWTLRTRR